MILYKKNTCIVYATSHDNHHFVTACKKKWIDFTFYQSSSSISLFFLLNKIKKKKTFIQKKLESGTKQKKLGALLDQIEKKKPLFICHTGSLFFLNFFNIVCIVLVQYFCMCLIAYDFGAFIIKLIISVIKNNIQVNFLGTNNEIDLITK